MPVTSTHDFLEQNFEAPDWGTRDTGASAFPYPRKKDITSNLSKVLSWTFEFRPFSKIFPVYRFRYPTWVEIQENNEKRLIPSSKVINLSKPIYLNLDDGKWQWNIHKDEEAEGRTSGELQMLKFFAEIFEPEYERIVHKFKDKLDDKALAEKVGSYKPDKFGPDSKIYGSFVIVNEKVQALDIKATSFNPQAQKNFRKTLDFENGIRQYLEMTKDAKVVWPFLLTSFIFTALESSQKNTDGSVRIAYEPKPMGVGDDMPELDKLFVCQLNKRGELITPLMVHPADAREVAKYLAEVRNPNLKPEEARTIERPKFRQYPDQDSGHVVFINQGIGKPEGVSIDLWKGSRKDYFSPNVLKELATEKNLFNYKPSDALSIFGGFKITVNGEWIPIAEKDLKANYAGQREGKHFMKYQDKDVEVTYHFGHLQENPLDPDLPTSEVKETPIYSDDVRKRIRQAADLYNIPIWGGYQKSDDPFAFLKDSKTVVQAVREETEEEFNPEQPVPSKKLVPEFASV